MNIKYHAKRQRHKEFQNKNFSKALNFGEVRLKYWILIVFFFPVLYSLAQKQTSTSGNLQFIENKGQWNKNILYKADIGNGAVFVENNCLTFNFVDPTDISFSYAHNKNKNSKPPDIIHFYSYKVHLLGSRLNKEISGSYPTKDYCNYYIGNDSRKWASKVSNYKIIRFDNVYNNIDLNIYSSGNDLKYDFIIHPGGKVEDIALRYEGLNNKQLRIENGELRIKTSFNDIVELDPYAYIQGQQKRAAINCKYILEDNVLRFSADNYDKSKVLVIDPKLIFSTYSGSISDNWGFTATFDNENNVYSGGIAFGVGYPVTSGAYQTKFAGDTTYYWGEDIAIIKYDPTGKNRLYATYLGGNSAEMPHSFIVNDFNELLIFGTTGSDNFPTTQNAYSRTFKGGTRISYDNVVQYNNGSDIFVSKLSADGSKLLASTYVGGSANDGLNFRQSYESHMMHGNDSLYFNYADGGRGEIITDKQNDVYIGSCTYSNDFPVNENSFQPAYKGKQDGVVFKLDYNLSNLIWSSFLGGNEDDAIYSIDVDNNYNLYAAGGTNSRNFPVSSNAINKDFLGGTVDAFVAHISKDGTKLINSTYFGSPNYDQAYFVRTDKFNYPYIAGQTKASGSTLIHNANYSTPNSGQFIAKLTPTLDTLKWSTVFGSGNGRPNISITAFAVDICDKIYLSGWGREWAGHDSISWTNINGTKNMDITGDAIQKQTDGQDFYVMVLLGDASQLYYATYFGEIHNNNCSYGGHDHVDGGTSRFDKRGNVYESVCASCGRCQDFPTYPNPGAWSETNNSNNCNNAVFKINIFKGFALADFVVPNTGCAPYTVNFVNNSEGTIFRWDFGDNTGSSTEKNPTHVYKKSGIYNITLIAIDLNSCNLADTITKQLQILSDTTWSLPDIDICKGDKRQIGLSPFNDTTLTYTWTPQSGLSDPFISNPYAYPETTTTYQFEVGNKICTTTVDQKVIVHNLSIATMKDTDICYMSDFVLSAKVEGEAPLSYHWSSSDKFTDTLSSKFQVSGFKIQKPKIYYLKVTNPWCEAIDSIHVNVKKILITVSSDTVMCKGDTIQLRVINNNPSDTLSYKWQPVQYIIKGANTSQITFSPNTQLPTPYNIYITATNKLGCIATDSVNITVAEVNADSVITNIRCFSECNGRIKLIPRGGISPYTFLWSNEKESDTLTDLCAGNYKITITDFKGCKFEHRYLIKSPDNLTIKIIDKKDVFCNEICNGSSTVSSSGGTPPYRYEWINGQTDSIANNLCAGSYSVTVTDKSGCIASIPVGILDTSNLNINIEALSPKCYGNCNGRATVVVTGGQLPYTYLWANGQTGKTDTLLCAGANNVIVTEAAGCQRQVYFTLHSPLKIKTNFILIKKPICFGDCDGVLKAEVTGGTSPYKYQWDNEQIVSDTFDLRYTTHESLCAGIHRLTIADKNKCAFDTSITITTSDQIKINIKTTNVPCSNVCIAEATANVTGGTPPYNYYWSNDRTGKTTNGLCNGNYDVTVSDANLCQMTGSFVIKDSSLFPKIIITAIPDSIHPGQSSNISLRTQNSELPASYKIKWSPADGLSSTTLANIKASPTKTTRYYVIITDNLGCTYRDSIDIKVFNVICDQPYIFIPNAFTPDANVNNILYVRSSVVVKIHFEIYDRWGEKVFETNDISRGWDGTYKGRKCNPGVFDYYIEATCLDNEIYKHKGNITLIR